MTEEGSGKSNPFIHVNRVSSVCRVSFAFIANCLASSAQFPLNLLEHVLPSSPPPFLFVILALLLVASFLSLVCQAERGSLFTTIYIFVDDETIKFLKCRS